MAQSRPVRVAVLSHTAVMSGAEVALLRMVRELDPQRVQPIVLVFGDGPLVEQLRMIGTEVHVLPLDPRVATADRHALTGGLRSLFGRAFTTVRFTMRLRRRLRELDVDIVHCNSLKADLLGGIAGRLARRPVVWYVHDRITADYLSPALAAAVRSAARVIPHDVIANSRSTLQALGGRRGAVAYPGLPASEFAADVPGPPPDPLIGIVGRISPTKGQDVFLRAAALVLARRRGTRFVVIGAALFNEQDYADRIQALVKELGIADRVRFTGHVAGARSAMAGLTALVHASPVPEPFGQVIVEAMALGVPVIATAAGGVPEITGDDDRLALRVPPSDVSELATAMFAILDDPTAAHERATRAQQSVRERFTSGRTAETVTTVWERAAARRSR